ncbi:MAG: glycosyltransferase [Desulfovibrionaceae bacterium]
MLDSARGVACLDDYIPYAGEEAVERIQTKAGNFRNAHVAHINSTYYGGGVAELLSSLTILMNSAGVKTGWRTIQGSPDFFSVTKKMHNALQSGEINLSDRKKEIYESVIRENAMRIHLDHHDFVFIHDPQPLPLITHYRKSMPWIWRCHVDLSSPNQQLVEYLRSFIEQHDAVALSSPLYKLDIATPQARFLPSIDPFCIKNRDMSEKEVNERLDHYDIPRDLPIVTQISRFDRWKDPEGVVRAFRKAREEVDATLVLLGNVALDDPEGEDVYQSLVQCREERIIILSKQDTALVNALQRKAAVVLQKSLREGFGLTVAEAMWKGAAVIGSDVGGIPQQIAHGENGFLVKSEDEAAEWIVKLLQDHDLRRRVQDRARATVRERFLLTASLERYLDALAGFETRFVFNGGELL